MKCHDTGPQTVAQLLAHDGSMGRAGILTYMKTIKNLQNVGEYTSPMDSGWVEKSLKIASKICIKFDPPKMGPI